MVDYFVQYKKELLLLALAALALVACTALFIFAMVKIVKGKNERVRSARTMELPSDMKLKNSLTHLFFSVLGAAGITFFICTLFYITKPQGFSLEVVTSSVAATCLLFAVLVFLLLSALTNILYFFTSSVAIKNEIIYIRYYLLRNYAICVQQVLSFEVRKGVYLLSLPVGRLKFTNQKGEKKKIYFYLSEESNIILNRYLLEKTM